MQDYGGKVVHVYKKFPLNTHPWALKAALAAESVFRINPEIFWDLRDYLFTNQNKITVENIDREIESFLQSKSVDSEQYKQKLPSPELQKAIDEDAKEPKVLGINATPTFFINGRPVRGAQPAAVFKKAIEEAIETGGLSSGKTMEKPAK